MSIIFFLYNNDSHKNGLKLDLSEKFNFPWNQLDAIVFVFFTRTTQNQSGIIK